MINSKHLADSVLPEIPPFDWLMPLAPWEDPQILKQTLQSLKDQTWMARSLVVSVDGQLGSQLISVLDDSGLHYELIEFHEWQGTGPVLARGVLACKSELIVRVDSDDFSLPSRSEWQIKSLLSNPHVAVVGGQLQEVIVHAGQTTNCGVRTVPLSNNKISRMIFWRNPLNHPTVAFRRSSILLAGNYRACPCFEDWDLWLRVLSMRLIINNDPRILVKARVGAGHLSRRHGSKYLVYELKFLAKMLNISFYPAILFFPLFLLRLPLRVMPAGLLSKVTKFAFRTS